MQPEDMRSSTGKQAINAGEQRIPDLWVGWQVEAVVVRLINPDQPEYSTVCFNLQADSRRRTT